MRKLVNLLIVGAVAFAVIALLKKETMDTGPPNEAISLQADDIGLTYFDSLTVRTTSTARNDPADPTNPCSDDPMTAALIALTSATTAGTSAFESEVSAPLRGTRAMLAKTQSSERRGSTPSWGGLLRMVNDTGSRTVPVV